MAWVVVERLATCSFVDKARILGSGSLLSGDTLSYSSAMMWLIYGVEILGF